MKWLVAAALAVCLGGCSFMHYEDPSGRKLTIGKFGQDTEIGKLEAVTPDEALTIENYNAKQAEALKKALDTFNELLQRIPKAGIIAQKTNAEML